VLLRDRTCLRNICISTLRKGKSDDDDDDDNNNGDTNFTHQEAEKNPKVRFCVKMQRMWNVKCDIVPVTIGPTGIERKVLKKNLESRARKTLDKFTTIGPPYLERHT
jgi:hypothetical protein